MKAFTVTLLGQGVAIIKVEEKWPTKFKVNIKIQIECFISNVSLLDAKCILLVYVAYWIMAVFTTNCDVITSS